jgi:ferredoxin/uncharacterized iron-regulated membrane protein
MDAPVVAQKPSKWLSKSRKLHKWLMAFVGVQLFVWSLTGVYMVLPSIHYIHGDHLVKQSQPHLQASQVNVSFSAVLEQFPSAQNIHLGWLGERAIYRFTSSRANLMPARQYMLDANSGEILAPLSEEQIIALLPHLLNLDEVSGKEASGILSSTTTNAAPHTAPHTEPHTEPHTAPHTAPHSLPQFTISQIQLLTTEVPSEISTRGLPLWQVNLDTWNNTTLYISQNSGQLITIRHHAWRLFDAFWRLHIMDYTQGEDISNKLLAFSSLIAFVAILSGLVMLYFRLFARSSAAPVKPTQHQDKNRLTWLAKKAHKWLALFVFVQLALWVVSGFILGRLDHSIASGDVTLDSYITHEGVTDILARANAANAGAINKTNNVGLADIASILSRIDGAESVSLQPILNTWVYQIQHNASRHDYWPSRYSLVNAFTGELFSIDNEVAQRLALQSHKNASQLSPNMFKSRLLQSADAILPKEQNPIWRVFVNDEFDTQVLIRASTGEVLAHVNSLTLWHNLLLKLHFMDYANEGSFNNIFIKVFALITLLLSLTGLAWLYQLIKERQFSLSSLVKRASSQYKLTVYKADNSKVDLVLNSNDTILDGLLKNDIDISSSCAGGGMCGKCICLVPDLEQELHQSKSFKLKQKQKALRPTQAELTLLSSEQLEQNWRLACQHRIKRVDAIKLP